MTEEKDRRGRRPDRGGGGDKKPRPRKEKRDPKGFLEDASDQVLDTMMGPIMDEVIGLLPEKLFEGEVSRRLLGMSGWAANILSVFVGRKTNMPGWADNLRTRSVSAWKDRIDSRLKGGTLHKRPADKTHPDEKSFRFAMANFTLFILRLDEVQWAAWQLGMDELDEIQRKRLILMFAGMKDRHIDKLVGHFRAKSGDQIDWGLFFRNLETMGILPAEKSTVEEKDRSGEAIQRILDLTGDEMDRVRTTMTSFLAYVADHISKKAHGEVLNFVVDWSDEQFKAFAELTSHEERAATLLGQIVDDNSMKDKFSGLLAGVKELLKPLGIIVTTAKEAVEGIMEHYRLRAKESLKRTNDAIRTRRRINDDLRARFHGSAGGNSQ